MSDCKNCENRAVVVISDELRDFISDERWSPEGYSPIIASRVLLEPSVEPQVCEQVITLSVNKTTVFFEVVNTKAITGSNRNVIISIPRTTCRTVMTNPIPDGFKSSNYGDVELRSFWDMDRMRLVYKWNSICLTRKQVIEITELLEALG